MLNNESHRALGIRENLSQFSLLVLVNAFVGAMVGLERAVLPLLAEQELGVKSASALLSFVAMFGLSKALANYFAGRASDKWGRKPVLLLGWAIALPVAPLLMWAPTWGWIIAANALLGVSQGLTWSTTVVMKIDLAGPRNRGMAMGINEAAGYLAVGVSALASGVIADHYGLRLAPFTLGLAFALLGGLISLVMVRETQAHADSEGAQTGEVGERPSSRAIFTRTSWSDPDLSSVSQAGLVNNLNDGIAWGLFPLMHAQAGMSLSQIATLAALYPATWGLGQLATGPLSDKVGRKPLIGGGMLLQGIALGIVAESTTMAGFASGAVLLGVGTAMVYPTLLAAIGDVAAPSWRAEAVGVYRLWRDNGYVVGAIAGGLLVTAVGMSGTAWAAGGLTAASGLFVGIRMRETLPNRHSAERHAQG